MRNRIRHPQFTIGERVRFTDGTFAGTGVVDAATDDYSIIWVWTDGGAGRKMFLQGLGTIVESIEEPEPDAGILAIGSDNIATEARKGNGFYPGPPAPA